MIKHQIFVSKHLPAQAPTKLTLAKDTRINKE